MTTPPMSAKELHIERMTRMAESLPTQFSVASVEHTDPSKGLTQRMADDMRVLGLLRKQGACYYKPGFPPTLDQAMMINIVTLTADEMEEVPAEEFMEILKGRLSRRKYADCASLVQPHIRPGVSALSIARVLYQTLPPRQWAAFESAVNDTTF